MQMSSFNPILTGVLVHFNWRGEGKNNYWNINPIVLKLGRNVYATRNFSKMSKRICPLSELADVSTFFNFFKIFQNFCSNLTEKLFLRAYDDKSNIILVLERNYIDFNCFISKKRVDSEKPINHFCFFSNSVWKSGCGRPYPNTIF